MKKVLESEFQKEYKKLPQKSFFAPGRLNMIGEHIDYNGGLVMPCAITMGTYLLLAPNSDHLFRINSANFEESVEIPLASSYIKSGESWYNYPLGVIHFMMQDKCNLDGLDLLYYGNIPIGSGLSSSASIELVTAFALNDFFSLGYSLLELVLLSQRVENKFIGVSSGIMDQFAVAFGQKDKALLLNCNNLEYAVIDSHLDPYLLAIINTNKPRKLSASKYNERVGECALALKALQEELDLTYLCDIDSVAFQQYQYLITSETVRRRAQHVIEESERVKKAATALAGRDLTGFGKLMYESHDSLKMLYEVSGNELDAIVDYALTDKNVIGARMTGAGFGGCAIALVAKEGFQRFSAGLTVYYAAKIGYSPTIYSSEIGRGVCTWLSALPEIDHPDD
ncbi:galactokinase [Mucilaginibacter sp. SMC90]|uniref:galactokinase n=1 Tax=Mucilaginibacter sp. SMC90 TaxID=2929803 RepID=UPI001FB3BC50|nr:galactokinase [Mucilaginibacter sp. SMC90]UOE47779.1 galactokinase [Mucilaginibacter sp. SMC90]